MTAKASSGVLGLVMALTATTGAVAEDVLPSDAFLEYLGEMVEQDGEWIDPLELDQLPDDAVDDSQESADPTEQKVAQPAEEQS